MARKRATRVTKTKVPDKNPDRNREPIAASEPGHTLSDAEKDMIDFLIDMAFARWRELHGFPRNPFSE